MVTKVASERGKAILVQRQQQVCCKVPFLELLLKSLVRVVVARRRHVVTVRLGVEPPFKGLLLGCGVAGLVFDLPCQEQSFFKQSRSVRAISARLNLLFESAPDHRN